MNVNGDHSYYGVLPNLIVLYVVMMDNRLIYGTFFSFFVQKEDYSIPQYKQYTLEDLQIILVNRGITGLFFINH